MSTYYFQYRKNGKLISRCTIKETDDIQAYYKACDKLGTSPTNWRKISK